MVNLMCVTALFTSALGTIGDLTLGSRHTAIIRINYRNTNRKNVLHNGYPDLKEAVVSINFNLLSVDDEQQNNLIDKQKKI